MKQTLIFFSYLFCAVLIFAAGLACGAIPLPWNEIFSGGDDTGLLLLKLRAIRMSAAFTAGGALALAGLLFQAVLRNPLAEPFTLGLSGGAAVGAALAFLFPLTLFGAFTVNIMAFTGAILILLLVLYISGGAEENLLLSGVITGTVMSGILMYLISIADNTELAGITFWMLGDLQGVSLNTLLPNGMILLAATVFALTQAGNIDALSLGREQAWDLGVNTKTLAVLLTVTGALLTAGTVAMTGIIGFCGLVVPHAVRKLHGAVHRRNILPCVLLGGSFLMLCDVVSRLGGIREIPVGVITSLIGGPFFLWLLNRRRSYHGS